MENQLVKPKVVLIIALPQELSIRKPENALYYKESELNTIRNEIAKFVNPKCEVDLDIEFSSVGKVNITIGLVKALLHNRTLGREVKYVINAGSVGAIEGNNLKVGDIIGCDVAIQSDLDLTGIGTNTIGTNKNYLNYRHDNRAFHKVNCSLNLHWLPKTICASSDKFPVAYGNAWYEEKYTDHRTATVLDQEAGAIAVVVDEYPHIQTVFLKYVANIVTKAQLKGKESLLKSGAEWEQDLIESSDCQNSLLNSTKLVLEEIVRFEKSHETMFVTLE